MILPEKFCVPNVAVCCGRVTQSKAAEGMMSRVLVNVARSNAGRQHQRMVGHLVLDEWLWNL